MRVDILNPDIGRRLPQANQQSEQNIMNKLESPAGSEPSPVRRGYRDGLP